MVKSLVTDALRAVAEWAKGGAMFDLESLILGWAAAATILLVILALAAIWILVAGAETIGLRV
jgi:hypothetical protein